MDNYNLDEVKKLINSNLVTPEVFNNILKSTTRRLELYDDKDDLNILLYLSQCELVPKETKEEIDKYLAVYDSYNVKTTENIKSNQEERKSSVRLIFSLIVFLIIFCLLLLLNK